MKVRAAGPNKWEVFQSVPDSTGYSHAPTRDEVVLTLTDADLVSALETLDAIDHADGSITKLMQAHAKATAPAATGPVLVPATVQQIPTGAPLTTHEHDLATNEGMPEPPAHIPGTGA